MHLSFQATSLQCLNERDQRIMLCLIIMLKCWKEIFHFQKQGGSSAEWASTKFMIITTKLSKILVGHWGCTELHWGFFINNMENLWPRSCSNSIKVRRNNQKQTFNQHRSLLKTARRYICVWNCLHQRFMSFLQENMLQFIWTKQAGHFNSPQDGRFRGDSQMDGGIKDPPVLKYAAHTRQ